MAPCRTWAPHYDVYGHHHHRVPFKDLVHAAGTEPLDRWMKEPRVNTHSQLVQVRKESQIPHISYDLDGDRLVGQRDLFIAKQFDVGQKDFLTDEERDRCTKALGEGLADQFSWGHCRTGIKRTFNVSQRRGKILSVDNVKDMAMTYPSHPNAAKVPMHRTWTEMHEDRILERRLVSENLKRKWDGDHPTKAEEPYPSQERMVDTPSMTHIVQRAKADHEEQRERSGLYSEATPVNPEREQLVVGLGHRTCPEFHSRSQMMMRKKELLVRDLQEQRKQNEALHVPVSVRTSEKKGAAHQFRCEEGDREKRYTATLMNDERRRDRLEYDLTHFGLQQHQNPRYSDQAHPWWTMEMPLTAQEKIVRSFSAPVMVPKLVEQYRDSATLPKTAPEANCDRNSSFVIPAPQRNHFSDIGEKTVVRWSEDMLINGRVRNQPRLFDSLKPIPSQKQDHYPLSAWSSFEYIKNRAFRNKTRAAQSSGAPPESSLPPQPRTATTSEKTKSVVSTSQTLHSSDSRKISALDGRDARSRDASTTESKHVSTLSSVGYSSKEKATPSIRGSLPDLPVKIQTTFREVPRGPDLTMMDRTTKGFFAGVRSSGFQRVV